MSKVHLVSSVFLGCAIAISTHTAFADVADWPGSRPAGVAVNVTPNFPYAEAKENAFAENPVFPLPFLPGIPAAQKVVADGFVVLCEDNVAAANCNATTPDVDISDVIVFWDGVNVPDGTGQPRANQICFISDPFRANPATGAIPICTSTQTFTLAGIKPTATEPKNIQYFPEIPFPDDPLSDSVPYDSRGNKTATDNTYLFLSSVSGDIIVDGHNAIYLTSSEGAGDDEDVFVFKLKDKAGNPRQFAQQGVYVFAEDGSTLAACSAQPIIGTGNNKSWNSACSDIICASNSGLNGQGQLLVLSDTPKLADLQKVPDFCAGAANVKAGLLEDAVAGGKGRITFPISASGQAPAVNVGLEVESDTQRVVALNLSELVSVNTPALPPVGVAGLAALLAGMGGLLARRRSKQSS